MTPNIVLLAALMALVTYPSRALPLLAPGMHRLPLRVQTYIRLMGPAVLAALAAINVMVVLDAARHPSFHVGIEWLAVGVTIVIVALRRGLLVGLVAAAVIAAVARSGVIAGLS